MNQESPAPSLPNLTPPAWAWRRLGAQLRGLLLDVPRWLAIGLVVLGCGALLATQFWQLRQVRWERLESQLRAAAEHSAPILALRDQGRMEAAQAHALLRGILDNLARQPDIQATALYDGDGILQATQGRPGRAPPAAGAVSNGAWISPTLSQPITLGGERLGLITAQANFSGLYPRLGQFALTLALMLLAILALVWRRLVALRRQLAEARASAARLEQLDPVSGVANRGRLLERLRAALAGARPRGHGVALLCVDLDNFRVINESLGPAAGDHLLRVMGHRLEGVLAGHGAIGRLGGDEYALLLSPADEDRARKLARLVLRTLSHPVQVADQSIYMGASIGIALSPQHGTDAETLLRNADIALFQVKEAGKDDLRFYTEAMADRAQARYFIETNLRKALERGELTLHYQPQVDVETRAIVGVEALMRWRSAEYGSFASGDFISVAEQSGLINQLGNWALHAACRQARAWQDVGLRDLTVSVNLSAHQFHTTDVVALVKEALLITGLRPGMLELELTETILMREGAEVRDKLTALTDLGVRLAIDDFGTGYSSLSYLKRLPIQRLKIDKSFVRESHTAPDDAAIATAIIGMARGLGVEVTAEGVENQEQLDFLRRAGCQIVQGYYFGQALPADELEKLVRRVRGETLQAPAGTI